MEESQLTHKKQFKCIVLRILNLQLKHFINTFLSCLGVHFVVLFAFERAYGDPLPRLSVSTGGRHLNSDFFN